MGEPDGGALNATFLRERLASKTPAFVSVDGREHVDYQNEVEVDGGAITIHFADGSLVAFTAEWHQDGTAGLYAYVKEADRG